MSGSFEARITMKSVVPMTIHSVVVGSMIRNYHKAAMGEKT